MIMKKFKILITLIILIFYCINSYAAISVSDGSAFITKQEFSADINIISNRMNYLQNSIDSKIDSLVASYLTRNGIWDGSKQALLNKDLTLPLSSYTIVTGTNAYTQKTNIMNLFKSNKTGLAFIYFRYKSNADKGNQARWGFVPNVKGITYYYSDNCMFVNMYFVNVAKSTENIYTFEIGKTKAKKLQPSEQTTAETESTAANLKTDLSIPVPIDYINVNSTFFVTKDITYGCYIQADIFTSPSYVQAGSVGTSGAAMSFNFKEVNVY